MLDELDRLVFPAGEIVFSSGDAGDCAYLIQEGSVEVMSGSRGSEVRISTIGQSEMFGEVALIDHQPRTATVRTLERTILIPIPRSLIQELLEKSNPILRHLLLVILERFRSGYDGFSPSPPPWAGLPEAEQTQRSTLQGEVTQKLSLAHSMTRALARDEFRLYYQPICDLASGQTAGFEALVRWQHPTEGLIPPMDFLWLAEETGLIRQLGMWTLERACSDWATLRQCAASEHPFISVNLSPSQLVSETLVDDVKTIIDQYDMNAAELKLELTETVIIEQPDLALRILSKLVDLGSCLALDDYGSGYSGLNYLQNFPIGTMKIDRAFISPVLESTQSREIVQSSIALAHLLKMPVVAEGIETEPVRLQLLQLGCDFGQGWLFGRPLPLSEHLAALTPR